MLSDGVLMKTGVLFFYETGFYIVFFDGSVV